MQAERKIDEVISHGVNGTTLSESVPENVSSVKDKEAAFTSLSKEMYKARDSAEKDLFKFLIADGYIKKKIFGIFKVSFMIHVALIFVLYFTLLIDSEIYGRFNYAIFSKMASNFFLHAGVILFFVMMMFNLFFLFVRQPAIKAMWYQFFYSNEANYFLARNHSATEALMFFENLEKIKRLDFKKEEREILHKSFFNYYTLKRELSVKEREILCKALSHSVDLSEKFENQSIMIERKTKEDKKRRWLYNLLKC